MASTFHLEIVTPDKAFLSEEVEMVIVRTITGDMGVLKNHAPLVTPLSIGKIKIKKDGSFKEAANAGGFIQIEKEKTTIIVDAAEWGHEIDLERASAAKERAEKLLQTEPKEGVDVLRAEIALKKAINRMKVGEEARK